MDSITPSSMTGSILNIPQEVLITCIAQFLNRPETYRLFALHRDWYPLLVRSRTICIETKQRLEQFLSDQPYREKLFRVLGCFDAEIVNKKRINVCISREQGEMKNIEEVKRYFEYINCFFVDTIYDGVSKAYEQTILKLEQIFDPEVNCTVSLKFTDLYKLHRLRINTCHDIDNMEDLDDVTYFAKSNNSCLKEDKTKPLMLLRGIQSIWVSDGGYNLTLSHNALLRWVSIENVKMDATENIAASQSLLNIPSIRMTAVEASEIIPGLAKSTTIKLTRCTGSAVSAILQSSKSCQQLAIRHSQLVIPPMERLCLLHLNECNIAAESIGSLSSGTQNIMLSKCPNISDVRHLGNVRSLYISDCIKIKHFPVASGSLQTWTFATLSTLVDCSGFSNLYRLTLRSCNQIVDISMLHKVKYLNITDCSSIIHYPVPSEHRRQEWFFETVSIAEFSGYHHLHQLTLKDCPAMSDVSALRHIHTLHVEACHNITDVSTLVDVKKLSLIRCGGVTDVSMLKSVVEELCVKDCGPQSA